MIIDYIERQIGWSRATFGPGRRTHGILAHIRKELEEIERDPLDVEEWCDVIILALDGAWRAGHSPAGIIDALTHKQVRNMARRWSSPGPEYQPTEHIRD